MAGGRAQRAHIRVSRYPGVSADNEYPNAVGPARSFTLRLALAVVLAYGLLAAGVLAWQGVGFSGNPNPLRRDASASEAAVDIAVLVFREGLECVLVLAAVSADVAQVSTVAMNPIPTPIAIEFQSDRPFLSAAEGGAGSR
jgi:hypothetical protein